MWVWSKPEDVFVVWSPNARDPFAGPAEVHFVAESRQAAEQAKFEVVTRPPASCKVTTFAEFVEEEVTKAHQRGCWDEGYARSTQ